MVNLTDPVTYVLIDPLISTIHGRGKTNPETAHLYIAGILNWHASGILVGRLVKYRGPRFVICRTVAPRLWQYRIGTASIAQ